MSDDALKKLMVNEVCKDQRERTRFAEDELKRLARRLERDKVASIFQVQVYAFNCTDPGCQKHGPHPFHLNYVAGGSRFDVPDALPNTIKALEHVVAELKKRVQ